MSLWDDIAAIIHQRNAAEMQFPAQVGAAVGAAASGGAPAEPTAKLKHPAAPYDPVKDIQDAFSHPPVAPGEAIKQTAESALGIGPIAGNLRYFWVWVIIILVGLIGVWGLIAPGGGVALIERARR